MKKTLCSLLFMVTHTMAATIAVIDSGVDVEHKDLQNNLWINPTEIADNGRDEDKNGYQDDVFGWNFAEQNNLVIDRKYIGTFSSDPNKFFDIQGKMFLQQATQEEMKWIEQKREDPNFLKEMQIFGNFVHGTHVAGITAKDNSEANVLSVKLIPTEVSPVAKSMKLQVSKISELNNDNLSDEELQKVDSLRLKILKIGLSTLAKEQMKMLEEIAAYVGGLKADIANGSFGTGFPQAQMLTAIVYKMVMGKEPSEKQLNDVTIYFLNELIASGKSMVEAAPDTLFVFASGNDGLNNDKYPTSPTNIKADNVISVGASYKYDFLAPFSNYGKNNVDVVAPGMLIHSSIPGNEYLKVSGTSQAAPYVANIAAKIKDINPNLKPKQIKEIILGTVDVKSFLQNKIKAQGIVNFDRATYAANLSLSSDVITAIEEAKVSVADVKSSSIKMFTGAKDITPIPLIPMFK